MKFCTEVGDPKGKNAFISVETNDPFLYFAPIFDPHNAFSMGRSKYCSNEARGMIVAVKSSNDVPREQLWYKHKIAKYCNPKCLPLIPKTQKWGISIFSMRIYAWLSVWHMISQQWCDVERWFQRTTCRKMHIRSPMVTWLMTLHDPKILRLWPHNLWSSVAQQLWEIHGQFILTTNRKQHITRPVVTWQMTSRDPEWSWSWPISLKLNVSETMQDRWSVQIDHLQETPYCKSSGHVTDDVTYPKRSSQWSQYLWTLIYQKLCKTDGWLKLTCDRKPH